MFPSQQWRSAVCSPHKPPVVQFLPYPACIFQQNFRFFSGFSAKSPYARHLLNVGYRNFFPDNAWNPRLSLEMLSESMRPGLS